MLNSFSKIAGYIKSVAMSYTSGLLRLTVCYRTYRTGKETGDIITEGRKGSGNCLLESRSSVAFRGP